jgi:mono/diheme cytochrome c family protein
MDSIIMPGPNNWKKMFVLILGPLSLTLCAPLFILATAMAAPQASLPESSPKNKKIKELYHHHCFKCHGPDGKGKMVRDKMPKIPDFTNPNWQTERSKTQLLVSILEGKGTMMPAVGDKISKQQASDLVEYIRAFSVKDAKKSQP